MANEQNLKAPWKKGESGNPKGRPKGSLNRSTIAKKWLEAKSYVTNPLTKEKEWLSQEDQITLAQIREALKGNTPAYKNLKDCAYGSALQKIEQTITEQPLFPDVDVQEDESDK